MDSQKKLEYVSIKVPDPTSIGRGAPMPGCDGLRGYNTHRLKRDDKYHADEVTLSDEFAKRCTPKERVLEQIVFGNETNAVCFDEHETRLMATVIQWLGTPVGHEFLIKCGYVKGKGATKREIYDMLCDTGIEFNTGDLKKMLGIK